MTPGHGRTPGRARGTGWATSSLSGRHAAPHDGSAGELHGHIPFITDLDGPEAATLGPVPGRVTAALRDASRGEKTYVYVFGDRVPHLHLHLDLAPHRDGDALRGGPGLLEPGAEPAPRETHERVAAAAREALAGFAPSG